MPRLIFLQAAEFEVNKQDQRTMNSMNMSFFDVKNWRNPSEYKKRRPTLINNIFL